MVTEAERLVYEGPPTELVGIDAPGALDPYASPEPGATCGGSPSESAQVSRVAIRERP